MNRESGILLPIFSLASRHGIGCFSEEAYAFVDFLEHSGQGYWQILPVGPTGFGNSPYQPFSAFAGNPYFISLEALIEDGLLGWADVDGIMFGKDLESVDYGALYENRFPVLKKAFREWKQRRAGEDNGSESDDGGSYEAFAAKESYWLDDYALYMAIKEREGGKPWLEWEEPLRMRDAAAMEKAREELEEEAGFHRFLQYEFDRQWRKLHAYAASKKVKVIGDLPLYVAMDSADAWAHPEAFRMDAEKRPEAVTGCPPDAFSPTGQLWGNPAYDWEAQREGGFEWWINRIIRNYEWYDVIRFDHFHGFSEYYAIPYGDGTAENGTVCKGPGMELFRAIREKAGKLDMIAEDLGTVTEENQKLLAETGLPGMNVLQYAFTSWDSIYVTHRHKKNSVVYTGTHDNTPTRAWAEEINDGQRDFTRRYVNSVNTDYGQFVWDIIREAYRSVADLCIIPLQDYLCKGKEARINCPGQQEGNWQWRLLPGFLSDDLASSIRVLVDTYGRAPQ